MPNLPNNQKRIEIFRSFKNYTFTKNFVQVFPKAMIGPDVDEGGRNPPWEAIAFQDYELVRLVCITLVQPKHNDKGGEKLRNPPRASGRKK